MSGCSANESYQITSDGKFQATVIISPLRWRPDPHKDPSKIEDSIDLHDGDHAVMWLDRDITPFTLPSNPYFGSNFDARSLANLIGAENIMYSFSGCVAGTTTVNECASDVVPFELRSNMQLPGETGQTPIVVMHSLKSVKTGSFNSGFNPFYSGNKFPTWVQFWNKCAGEKAGCGGCKDLEKPAYQGTVTLKLDITLNMLPFCTKSGTENIHESFCYGFVGDYLNNLWTQDQKTADSGISNYLVDYCKEKFPNKTLDIFYDPNTDPEDVQICACNMSDSQYSEFLTSLKGQFPDMDLGSIQPACLFPPCVASKFKRGNLDGCPIPQCFEEVNISNSQITGPVNVSQNAKCQKIIGSGGTGGNGGNGSSSVWSKYKVPIIIGIVILIIIIIAIISVIIYRSRSNVAGQIQQ